MIRAAMENPTNSQGGQMQKNTSPLKCNTTTGGRNIPVIRTPKMIRVQPSTIIFESNPGEM